VPIGLSVLYLMAGEGYGHSVFDRERAEAAFLAREMASLVIPEGSGASSATGKAERA
jgi:hypothetical protein